MTTRGSTLTYADPSRAPDVHDSGQQSGSNPAPVRRGTRWRIAIPYVVIVLASCLLVGWAAATQRVLSPVDEPAHIDYLYRVHHGHLLRRGEIMTQEALRQESCRGIRSRFRPPPCRAPFNPRYYQGRGANHADVYSPVYYVVTDVLSRGVLATGATTDLVSAARFIGGLWLALGLCALWAAGRLLRAPPLAVAATLVGLTCATGMMGYAPVVTPDASAFAASGLLLLTAINVDRRRGSFLLLAAAAAFAAVLKPTFILIVLAVALFLLLGALGPARGEPSTRRRRLLGAAVLLVAGLGGEVAWLIVHAAVALPTHEPVQFHATKITLGHLEQSMLWIMPWEAGRTHLQRTVATVFDCMLIFSPLVAVLSHRRRLTPVNRLALAAAAGLVLGGPILIVVVYLSQHVYYMLPRRYGLSVWPMLGLVLAAVQRRRLLQVVSSVIAAATLVLYALTL